MNPFHKMYSAFKSIAATMEMFGESEEKLSMEIFSTDLDKINDQLQALKRVVDKTKEHQAEVQGI